MTQTITKATPYVPMEDVVKPRPKRRIYRRGVKKATPVVADTASACKHSPTKAHHWIEEVMGSNLWTCKWCKATSKFKNTLSDHMKDDTNPWKTVSPPRRHTEHKPKDWTPTDQSY